MVNQLNAKEAIVNDAILVTIGVFLFMFIIVLAWVIKAYILNNKYEKLIKKYGLKHPNDVTTLDDVEYSLLSLSIHYKRRKLRKDNFYYTYKSMIKDIKKQLLKKKR